MKPVEADALEELKDPVKSAASAGLRYVSNESRGITRTHNGTGFCYRDPSGKIVRDEATLRRIKSLVIPPAWTEVWICTDPNGHLQATGRDLRKRKQFRYHPRWREVRDETKYARMIIFAKALPAIRERLKKDLALPGLPREKVLATVVRLLEVSLIRVGNDEYARQNDSFGLTTMRDQHVDVNGSRLRFHFRGKSGKWHDVDIRDRRLAKIVKSCQDLPGQELFQFMADDGQCRDVRSDDVNAYLRETSGEDFTAKDFRTWAGTVLAAMALKESGRFNTKAQAKKKVVTAIESVAKRLGNTPAVCKKCYVHPHILDSYLDGTLAKALKKPKDPPIAPDPLKGEEAAVLGLLQKRLSLEEKISAAISREKKKRPARAKQKSSPSGK